MAINNVSAAITVPPETKKYVHLGIILEERNGEQEAKSESTVLVVLQGGIWQCFRKRPVKDGMTRSHQFVVTSTEPRCCSASNKMSSVGAHRLLHTALLL